MNWRDNQVGFVKSCRDYLASEGEDFSIAIAPTAAGKSWMIGGALQGEESMVLVLQPSIDLLEQNYKRFTQDFGGTATRYDSKTPKRNRIFSKITYTTLGSVRKLGKELRALGYSKVIIDECHYKFSPDPKKTFVKFLEELQPTHVLGVTATPFRLGQYGGRNNNYSRLDLLHTTSPRVFKRIIHIIPISSMVGRYWSPLEYIEYDFEAKLLRLNSSGAEFTEKSMKRAITASGVLGNVEKRIHKLSQDEVGGILVFCDSVATAEHLNSKFDDSEVVHSNSKDRAGILERFKSGQTRTVFNVDVLTTGFDFPELSVILMARPTNSLALYYQMVGRVSRIHPQKEKGLIYDFVGNVAKFGRVEDLNFDTIEGYGLGFFSGKGNNGILLTNTRMDTLGKTKKSLRKKVSNIRMTFGKYKDVKLCEVPISYLKYLDKNVDKDTKMMRYIRESLRNGVASEGENEYIEKKTDGMILIDFNNIMFILNKGGNLNKQGVEEYITQLKRRIGNHPVKIIVDCKSAQYWRLKIYPSYKANRKSRVPDMDLMRRRAEVLSQIPHIRLEGLEADDVFAAYARSGKKLIVVSSDSDFAQLYMLKGFQQYNPLKCELLRKTKEDALASLVTKTLKGDGKDNIKKCHPNRGIATKKLSPVPQQVLREVINTVKSQRLQHVYEVPLRGIIRRHLEQFDIIEDIYNVNYDLLTLLSAKFLRHTDWTDEKIITEVEKTEGY